ncbi:MAG: hypothetical protein ACR2QC_02565 [Gammaproteobacteria bacterium]
MSAVKIGFYQRTGVKNPRFQFFYDFFSPLCPIPAKAGISAAAKRREICAFGAKTERFRLSPEWRILIKRLKVPPFRRKPESHSPIRRKAATICAYGAEIPAFAGMEFLGTLDFRRRAG